MSTKLFLDEDMHSDLVPALRRRGFDSVHVRELGREGMSDGEQLMEATRLGRAIFSFNQKDFVRLHRESLERGTLHMGIIIAAQMPLGDALRRTLDLLTNHEDLRGNLWHL